MSIQTCAGKKICTAHCQCVGAQSVCVYVCVCVFAYRRQQVILPVRARRLDLTGRQTFYALLLLLL